MSLKVITDPTIYLISQPEVNYGDLDCFITEETVKQDWQSDAVEAGETLPEIAGRLCYMSFDTPRPGGNKAYLQHILEVGHGSVLEASCWGFIFTGISRSLTHELVRHRHLSYSQLSQRYVDESEVAFVMPYALKESKAVKDNWHHYTDEHGLCKATVARNAYDQWEAACMIAQSYYCSLIDRIADKAPAELVGTDRKKWCRQAARSVLPNCTETKIFVTGNARSWRGFLDQRASRHAEVEIRRLAYLVWQRLKEEAPNLFSDYTEVALPDGTTELTTPYRKV